MVRLALAALTLAGVVWGQAGQGCRVRTLVGSPTTDAGDGGAAIKAELSGASGAAFDRDGNLYIADTFNHKVRRVALDGTISTFAGTGMQGFAGDGGPAVAADLNAPAGVAVDAAGNVYIGDTRSFRIRRVGPDGVIQTVAGTGVPGFNGDGPAGTAQIGYVSDLAIDSIGNVFLADVGNFRVRRISPSGMLETVAGNGSYGNFDVDGLGGVRAAVVAIDPRSIAVDFADTLYIRGLSSIWTVDAGGLIRRVAGTGQPARSDPRQGDDPLQTGIGPLGGMATDRAGILYYADLGRQRIGIIGADGKFAGSMDARPLAMRYLAAGPGLLVGGDANRIFRYPLDTAGELFAGIPPFGFEGDGGPATAARLNNPQGLALDSKNNLFIADAGNLRVRRLAADGVIDTWAGNGVPGSNGDGGDATAATLGLPLDLSLDGSGNLFIADGVRVRLVSPDRIIGGIDYKGQSPSAPLRVSIDAHGNLFLTEAARYGFTIVRASDGVQDYHQLLISRVSARPDSLFRTSNGNVAGLAAGALLDLSLPLNGPLRSFWDAGIFDRSTRAAQDDAGNFWVWDFRGLRRLEPDGALARILPNALNDAFGPLARPPVTEVNGLVADHGGNIYWSGDSRVRMLENPDLCQALYPPEIAFAGIENFASGEPGAAISPGEVIRIRGANLGPSIAAVAEPDNGRFGPSLAGATVTIGSVNAPVLAASRREVVVVAPFHLPQADVSVVVNSGTGDMLSPVSLPVRAVSPGLFPVVRNEDGSLNSASNPAGRGSTVTLKATGLGALKGEVSDGQLIVTDPLPEVVARVTVRIGGRDAEVLFAGATSSAVAGIMQVRVKVPSDASTGDAIQVELRAADILAGNPVAAAIQ